MFWTLPWAGYLGLGGAFTGDETIARRPVFSMLVDGHGLPVAGASGRLVIATPQRLDSGHWIEQDVITATSDSQGRFSWGSVPTGIDVIVEILEANRRQRVTIPIGTSAYEI